MLPEEANVPLPQDLMASKVYFEQLIHTLKEESINVDAMPFHSPYELDNCTWLANRWCEILDIPLIQKQRMLELDSPLIRLELINDILTKNIAPT
jgi:Lon protease-like protein